MGEPTRPPTDWSLPTAGLQRWFQAVITHPDGVEAGARSPDATAHMPDGGSAIETLITRSTPLDASQRLSIYADAYFSRLVECLSAVYPMLRRFVGAEVFSGFAFEFLQQHPSKSYTLHHLGRPFADWLEGTRSEAEGEGGARPVSEGPDWPELLVDLARLEWAIYEVFDGPGTEGKADLSADEILDLPVERWETARLLIAPCVRPLEFRFPVNGFFTTLRDRPATADGPEEQNAPADLAPPSPGRSWVALGRRNFVVQRHPISEFEHRLLTHLMTDLPLATALEQAAAHWHGTDAELAATIRHCFAEWAAWGFFTGIAD